MIDNENLIGYFKKPENIIKLTKETTFDEDSFFLIMALIENNTKISITDCKRRLLRLLDFDGNILKSFKPDDDLAFPVSVCVLNDPNEETIYFGDSFHHGIFVFNSNFD